MIKVEHGDESTVASGKSEITYTFDCPGFLPR